MPKKTINFSNPFKGRKWLLLLQEHSKFGMTFKPNLNIGKKRLGFSFRSNEFGFRGPKNVNGDGVVLGTSFAMGLSVSNGENWYENYLNQSKWINFGMPVGPENHKAMIELLYHGSHELLLFIYHPNVWSIARNFRITNEKNIGIFKALNWKTDLLSCTMLYFKWLLKLGAKKKTGYLINYNSNNINYSINTKYSYLDYEKNLDFFEKQVEVINSTFSKFNKIVVIRVPIKEEIVPSKESTELLKKLTVNYDKYWTEFKNRLDANIEVHEIDKNTYNFSDFLPKDTHWSVSGNHKFGYQLKTILEKENCNHFLRDSQILPNE